MFGDYVEKLAFNALPATFTPDMWAHQYLQQSNEVILNPHFEIVTNLHQINSAHLDTYIYVTDGPDSNIYGLRMY